MQNHDLDKKIDELAKEFSEIFVKSAEELPISQLEMIYEIFNSMEEEEEV